MLVPNQKIEVCWVGVTINWYKNKGYEFTKCFDTFMVNAEDLIPSCKKHVKVQCDHEGCNRIYESKFFTFYEKDKTKTNYCPSCIVKEQHKKYPKVKPQNAIAIMNRECIKRGYILLTKEYTDAHMNVEYIDHNGRYKHQTYNAFIRNTDFIYDSKLSKRRRYIDMNGSARASWYSKEKIIERIKEDGNEWLNPEEYINVTRRNMLIKCSCGNKYITNFTHYKAGQFRCNVCASKMSYGEYVIKNYLDSIVETFEYQKTFEDCINKYFLRFDFYLPQYNLILEFDGEQHYYTEEALNKMNPDWADSFRKTQVNDKIKNKYCYDNNIYLFRIREKDLKNLDKVIQNILLQCKVKDIV